MNFYSLVSNFVTQQAAEPLVLLKLKMVSWPPFISITSTWLSFLLRVCSCLLDNVSRFGTQLAKILILEKNNS